MTTIDQLARDEDGTIIHATLHVSLLCREIGKAFSTASDSYGKAAELPLASEARHAERHNGDAALIAVHAKLRWFLESYLESTYDFDGIEAPYSDRREPEDA